jgi:[acyl-carrier-protein] S-malonyltransferase
MVSHARKGYRRDTGTASLANQQIPMSTTIGSMPSDFRSSAAPLEAILTPEALRKRIKTAAVAFRGYEESHLGHSPELLLHPVYGPIVRETLDSAAKICADVLHAPVDLAGRILAREPSSLAHFVEDTASIVATEIAQIRILEQVFEVPVRQAQFSFGHSIGELSALVLDGLYEMEDLLPVPLAMAPDCAELTANTTIGILSVTGRSLRMEEVRRLSNWISSRGHGLIGPSTYLSPYQAILLGQGDTFDLLEREMSSYLHCEPTLRRRPNRWPPLHTPLVWERNIPNRAAVAMHHIAGGDCKPSPTVVSCTTGVANYDEYNNRSILADWTDHPQRVWDVMRYTMASGADLVIHMGPAPGLFPNGFERLSGRIKRQLHRRHLDRLGNRLFPSISRNRWLSRNLPAGAAVWRAPFVDHLILEEWLLAQDVS